MTVEIAGVTGSGKSTLAQAICSGRPDCRVDGPLQMRRLSHLPYVLHGLPRLLPLLGRWIGSRRMPAWTDVKLVIYLMEWSHRLARHPDYATGVTVLDQGPVYGLARLACATPPPGGTEWAGPWSRATAERWSESLDVIVWLDAPNEVLWHRVNTRAQAHEIKGEHRDEGMSFLERYRAAYGEVLAVMDAPEGPLVLRYDTSALSAQEIAIDVLDALSDVGSGRLRSDGDPA